MIKKMKDQLLEKSLAKKAAKFTNTGLSLFCNNCIGGIILNNLGQRFNSPTVNLYFFAPDYIAFLERLEYYLNQEISFSYRSKYDNEVKEYPIGTIEDVEMHFVHYHSFEEAKQKWHTRARRVNYDNMFIIGSDRDLCTPEIIERFLKLPYKNKIFFSAKKHPAKEVIQYKEYENEVQVGDLISDDNGWYFHFNVLKWLNTGQLEKYPVRSSLFRVYRFIRKKYQLLNRSQEKYEQHMVNLQKSTATSLVLINTMNYLGEVV